MNELEIGELSLVFEIADDFAVGIKSERVEESFVPFEDVSDDIHSLLQQQRWREAMNDFTAGLLDRANVVILDESLFPQPVLFEMETDETNEE